MHWRRTLMFVGAAVALFVAFGALTEPQKSPVPLAPGAYEVSHS
jgi:hypothetical protein